MSYERVSMGEEGYDILHDFTLSIALVLAFVQAVGGAPLFFIFLLCFWIPSKPAVWIPWATFRDCIFVLHFLLGWVPEL